MGNHFSTHVVIVVALVLGICSPSPAGDNKWTSNGPYGGMFGSFCFHPQKNKLVFANGWSGGLLRSRDGGMTWERLDLTEGNVTVRIHPRDPGTIIAAGGSIFRSTDQGLRWEQLGDDPFPGHWLETGRL